MRKKQDFDKVFRSGKTLFFNEVACRYWAQSPLWRIGFSFGKKHLPLAIERNRLRRLLSEALYALKDEWPTQGDVVFFTVKKPKKINKEISQSMVRHLLDYIKTH